MQLYEARIKITAKGSVIDWFENHIPEAMLQKVVARDVLIVHIPEFHFTKVETMRIWLESLPSCEVLGLRKLEGVECG